MGVSTPYVSTKRHISDLVHRMQSEGNANHFVSIGLNFGITIVSIVPTWIVLSELEHSHEVQVTVEEVTPKGEDNPTA